MRLALQGRSFLVTGPGGCGKSHVLARALAAAAAGDAASGAGCDAGGAAGDAAEGDWCRLFATNAECDALNSRRLCALPGASRAYEAR